MKKKTSVFLFKLWLYPPAILLGSYFAIGAAMSAFGVEDRLLHAMHLIRDNYESQTRTIYYAYLIAFFALMAGNVSFWGSVIYFKSGFCMLAPESFNAELVRNNRFMFWDEIVDRYLDPKFDKN